MVAAEKLDYWRLLNRFREIRSYEQSMSVGQVVLYRELVDYADSTRSLDKPFHMMNDALVTLTGLTLSGLRKAREALVNYKLIEYKPGKRNKETPVYKLCATYVSDGVEPNWNTTGALEGTQLEHQQDVNQNTSRAPTGTQTGTQLEHEQGHNQGHGSYSTLLYSNSKPSRKSAARTYDEQSEPYVHAKKLFEAIQVNDPGAKEPNLQHWANDMRLLNEADKRDWETITAVTSWCQQDSFWKANILSAKKLRQKFPQLLAKMNSAGGRNKPYQNNDVDWDNQPETMW